MAVNQLTGGAFQDILGRPLAYGTLLLELSADAITDGGTAINAGTYVKILLDANGNIQTSPAQSVWPNDQLTPINVGSDSDVDTFYLASVYSASGQLVWGPNAQQILSSPTPFNVGAWVPGVIVITS